MREDDKMQVHDKEFCTSCDGNGAKVHVRDMGRDAAGNDVTQIVAEPMPTFDISDPVVRDTIETALGAGDWSTARAAMETRFCPDCVIPSLAAAQGANAAKSPYIDPAQTRKATLTVTIPVAVVAGVAEGAEAHAHSLGSGADAQAFMQRDMNALFTRNSVACFYCIYHVVERCPHAPAATEEGSATTATATTASRCVRPLAVALSSNGRMTEHGEGELIFGVAVPKDMSAESETRLAITITAAIIRMSKLPTSTLPDRPNGHAWEAAGGGEGRTSAPAPTKALSEVTWASDRVSFAVPITS